MCTVSAVRADGRRGDSERFRLNLATSILRLGHPLTMAKLEPALWRDLMRYLRQKHATICRRWFDELEPRDMNGGVLRIRTSNNVQTNYLQQRCLEPFTDAAQATTGALVAVRFVNGGDTACPSQEGSAETPVTEPKPPNIPAESGPSMFGQTIISPDYSFETFVTGPGNRLAHAAAVAVANQPGTAYNPLFIHGGVGLGKTHLLQAICQKILENGAGVRICYISCDAFVNQFLDCVQKGEMNDFRRRYRLMQILVIDDIHFLANRERTQEEFFHTFNELYQANHQIILSSDLPPAEIPQLEERLVSRFQGGFVTPITKPTYETRVAILRAKSSLRELSLPDDVVSYIAAKIDSNARELEGALNAVQGHSSLQQRDITLELAKEALGEPKSGSRRSQITLQQIIDLVTDFYNIKLSDLQSKRRQKSIAVPRQVSMYLARKRTRFSLEQIGGYFGGRDHTTVMHAVKVIEQRIDQDPSFAHEVEQIDEQIRTARMAVTV